MMTVSIFINGKPIYTRTAVSKIKEKCCYILDDGSKVIHDPKNGVVELAIKMLKTIKEVK